MIVCSCRRISGRDYECADDLKKRLLEPDFDCKICLQYVKTLECNCKDCSEEQAVDIINKQNVQDQ